MHGVNTQILQATINYLAKQPYEQVSQIIEALRRSEQIPVPEPAPVEPEKKSK